MSQFKAGFAAMALGLLVSGAALAVEVGDAFPVLGGQKLDSGESLEIGQLAGKVVYVDVWASWCPPCRVALPVLQQWQKRYGEQGFTVLGINVGDDPEAARAALDEAGAQYPVVNGVTDDKLNELAVQTMPQAFLVDRQGRITMIHYGFQADESDELAAEIEALLAAP